MIHPVLVVVRDHFHITQSRNKDDVLRKSCCVWVKGM